VSSNLNQMNPVSTHAPFETSSNITSGAGIATVVVDVLQGVSRETWGKKKHLEDLGVDEIMILK